MNMNKLLKEYLELRRSLGFKLHSEGTALLSFISFLQQQNKDAITTELALTWAKLPTDVQPARWARRLSFVRGFARYCNAIDSKSEVPPTDLLSVRYQRPIPYIFSDEEIKRLLEAVKLSSVKNKFFSQTLYCLFGLLSVSGLRIKEALNLMLEDIDLQTKVLTIRNTKFSKSRLVPLHTTTISILTNYRESREKFMAGSDCKFWFVNKERVRLGYDCVKYHFDKFFQSMTLDKQSHVRKPHLHDFRHFFAITTLKNWYRNGEDVERRLPLLSTYLGHVETRDTYWYLSAFPGLMDEANKRLEKYWENQS